MSEKVIVVFKDTVSEEVIRSQASEVTANGGVVTHIYYGPGLKAIAAEIPLAYLSSLQASLTGDNSEIQFIEPDSTITIQT